MALHFAAGGSATEVASAGFNLVDVQYIDQVNELPDGTKAMVWLNEGEGVTQSFIDKVTPFLGNPKVFGFFLVDEPDPTGQYHTQVDAEDLKAESDWIHSRMPEAKTFITAMDMGSAENPDFSNTYNYDNTHIDLFGISAYPVRTGTDTVDYDMIDRTVAAAVESGIPTSQIVPIHQTFGGGNWTTNTGGKYVMPTADQLQTMMDHWDELVPSPEFDFAYAWGSQEGDVALESSPELQAVFREHNLSTAGTAASDVTTTDDSSTVIAPADATISDDSSTVTAASDTTTSDSSSTAAVPSDVTTGDDGSDTSHVAGDKAGSSVDRVLAALSSGSESLARPHDKTAGNGFAHTVQGDENVGANASKGGAAEIMSGRGGNDAFDFSWLQEKLQDKLQDKPHFDQAFLDGLKSGGLSDASSAGTAAHDRSDHVSYDSSTGSLSLDSDGTGDAAQTQLASHFPWQHHSL
ncbi:MAG: calcium-binding protein [Mesorhizobium sp.]|nr:MAG: calcium-binding protein [Mesorhizobium sp.]